jgi:hypothetical protein
MTRAEHLAWAKERALIELEANGPACGIASFTSDLTKHPALAGDQDLMRRVWSTSIQAAIAGKPAVRQWIEETK